RTRIIKACPNVESVEIELSDQESKDLGLRNAKRSEETEFANSLTALPEGMRILKMNYPGVVPANQLFSSPAIPLIIGKDLLSLRLNTISRQLQFLEIRAVLSDDIFDMTDSATSWPRLQTLYIDLDPCTPSGDWVLGPDLEASDVEPDYEHAYEDEVSMGGYKNETQWPARMHFPRRSFRTAVNRDILDDINLAVVQALIRMPNLRDLGINVGNAEAETGCICQLIKWSGIVGLLPCTRPHLDVLRAWKQIVEKRTGELQIQVLGYEHTSLSFAL
ncbi:unnamed protein product, partial [Aureobasidium uvarum]